MEVIITRDTVANGKAVFVGETVTVADPEGRYLVLIGKAVEPPPKKKSAKKSAKTKAKPKKAAKAGLNTENAGALVSGKKVRDPETGSV